MTTQDWYTQSRPRTPKPYQSEPKKEIQKVYQPKYYKGSVFNNETGLYQEIAWDNTTHFAKNQMPSDCLISVQMRSKRKDDDGLYPLTQQYINYPPTLQTQNNQVKTYKQEVYVPPHAIVDRRQSILQRNRELQEQQRRRKQEVVQNRINQNKSGIKNIIGLVQCEYQVPVAVTKQRNVVQTNKAKQNIKSYDYFDLLDKVYIGLK